MKCKYGIISIGIDPSMQYTGISISADGEIKKIIGIDLKGFETNTEKRRHLIKELSKIIKKVEGKAESIVCVIERTRLVSAGFLSEPVIKSMTGILTVVVDYLFDFKIPVYSVDTRSWKSRVVGSSKKVKNNLGVPEEKYLTVKYLINLGYGEEIIEEVQGRKEKGTFIKNGIKYMYNSDKADSAAISLYYFLGDREKLILENK